MRKRDNDHHDKNMKICQFRGREFMHRVKSMMKKYRNFPFLRRQYFKTELYCYIYIVIFGKHLSEL